MFSLKVKAAREGFFDRRPVVAGVGRAKRAVLSRAGAYVRQRAKTSIRRRKASAPPGRPPSSHVGYLRDRIVFAYDAATSSVVIGPTLLGNVLGRDVPRTLEYGGEVTILDRRASRRRRYNRRFTGPLLQRRVTYAARPYMGPARDAELPNLARRFEGSVRA